MSTSSKGLGFDRDVYRRVVEISNTISSGYVPPDFSFEDVEDELASAQPATMREKLAHSQEEALVAQAKVEMLQADLAREKLARSQDWEHNSGEQHVRMNPVLKLAAGMGVHHDDRRAANPPARGFFAATPISPKPKKKGPKKKGEKTPPNQRKDRHENVRDPPKVTPLLDANADEEVKRRTGFPTMQHLLAYIFVVCNGDFDVMTERRTILTVRYPNTSEGPLL